MSAKVLFVDDESSVLAGYQRTLHRDFEVDTAVGGELGLQALRDRGPYAVIVSDMRMPGMNGAQFLARAREVAPDTVRMLLTGFTDLDAAKQAVNEGNIFRFLTKPCEKDVLVPAINAGVEQYQIVRIEKELLEKTVVGSIKVLAEVLSTTSPEAFGRSMRIEHFVRHIAGKFVFEHPWRLEAATALSQLGCVTLETDIIQRAFLGMELSLEEQARFNSHPEAAMRLLSGIPRLEPVAWMIGQQLVQDIPNHVPEFPAAAMKEILLGATILKLAVAFDDLRVKPLSDEEAIARLRGRKREFKSELVDTLMEIKPLRGRMGRRIPVRELSTDMVLDQEIRNPQGTLLFAKGQEITCAVLIKLDNFAKAGLIDREIMVFVPV